MDDEFISEDLMSTRVGMMLNVAMVMEEIEDSATSALLLEAMDCLLYSINPPRGQLVSAHDVRDSNKARLQVVRPSEDPA